MSDFNLGEGVDRSVREAVLEAVLIALFTSAIDLAREYLTRKFWKQEKDDGSDNLADS
jgi:hypothetical protein